MQPILHRLPQELVTSPVQRRSKKRRSLQVEDRISMTYIQRQGLAGKLGFQMNFRYDDHDPDVLRP